MINIEKAESEFNNYVKNYDLNNENINLKFHHSHRVKQIAEEIAKSLNLSEEEIKLAKLIGLLHDIARFEQYTRYHTFSDLKSIDHGDYGIEILKQNNYIRNFIDIDEYDNIIFKAIKNHNKFKIEESLSEKELLFSKIIRDADKLDIFYEGAEIFWTKSEEIKEINNSKITDKVLNDFYNYFLIDRKEIETKADGIISFIGFLFDINFKYDFEVLKKEDYINKILDKFTFCDEKTAEQMKKIRTIAKSYIDKQL